MDFENSSKYYYNEDDIENIEKLAEGLAKSHHTKNDKEKKKKFSKKTNKFHELNTFLNTIPLETKKMTRDEKKAANVQRIFDKMEETSNKKKKNFKNDRKKIKTENEVPATNGVKRKLEIEESSHEEEKNKESNSNAEAKSSKTGNKSQITESIPQQKMKPADTQINPSFNLETHDNLFYYLYYYDKSERKTIEEIREKEFNGEHISCFRYQPKTPKGNGNEDGNQNHLPKKINKVNELVFQKTKFIQDSIRRKFKENVEKMNSSLEKDALVRDFATKHINKEEINNLIEKEFSYY